MKMYRANTASRGEPIKEVNVVRETRCFVYLESDNRVPKFSGKTAYFSTLGEAKDYLIKECNREIDLGNKRIEGIAEMVKRYEAKLAEIEKL